MGYDLRDFIFDLYKESFKQSQENGIHQQCEILRQRVFLLPEKDRESALTAINKYEQGQLQNVQANAAKTTIVKEILKQL